MALWETGERNASQTLPQDRLADVCQSKRVTILLFLRTKHDIYILMLILIFSQNKSVKIKPTLKIERCSPGGRNVLCTWHGRWRDPADCTASYKNLGNPYTTTPQIWLEKILKCSCRSEIAWFNTYKLCLWMRMNKPLRASKLIAPPKKTGALQIYNCITLMSLIITL